MFKLFKLIGALGLPLLIGVAILAAAETRQDKPSTKPAGRLVKSVSRALDASNKLPQPRLLKLNQSKLVLPGQTGEVSVQLKQTMYRTELTTERGERLETGYALVSTLQSLSPTSSYSFSFCSPGSLLETPHSFRLFSHGPGKNYLVWTQNRFIFLVEVSEANDTTETLMRSLLYYDSGRVSRQKAAAKELFDKKIKKHPPVFFWNVHIAHFVAQDFGLTTMPDVLNMSTLITEDEYGGSRNALREEMFVVSLSVTKSGVFSLQFVTPKTDVIYTASKKDGKWRITGKEPLTAKKAKELAPLLRG